MSLARLFHRYGLTVVAAVALFVTGSVLPPAGARQKAPPPGSPGATTTSGGEQLSMGK